MGERGLDAPSQVIRTDVPIPRWEEIRSTVRSRGKIAKVTPEIIPEGEPLLASYLGSRDARYSQSRRKTRHHCIVMLLEALRKERGRFESGN